MLAYIHKQALVAFLSMLAYLCHPFYLCLLICPEGANKQKGEIEGFASISCYANKGEIKRQLRTKSKHKATKGYLKHQRCLKGMLAYGYKQA
jgi:hypothetical protein